MSRRRILPAFSTMALTAVLAGASTASAADLCVNRAGCVPANTFGAADLQAALAAAAGTPEADRVLIGPGTYTRPGGTGFVYSSASPVEIAGGEADPTVIATDPSLGANGTALSVAGGAHVVRDLDVHVTLPGRTGVAVGGTTVLRDALVSAEDGLAATGVELANAAVLERVQVVQEGSAQAEAVVAFCACTVRDSSIATEGLGIRVSGAPVVVERARIRARVGIDADSSGATVADTLIQVVGADGVGVRAANFNASSAVIQHALSRVTIAGDGSAGQTGVRALADDGDEQASVTITDSIIAGVAVPLRRNAAGGRPADIAVRFTNLPATGNIDENTGGGTGAITMAAGVTSLPVAFANAAAGDLRLPAGSPLIDAGDPAADLTGVRDLGGTARPLDGNGDGTAVVDLGALESPAMPPTAPPATAPQVPADPASSAPVVTTDPLPAATLDRVPPSLRAGLVVRRTLRARVRVGEAAVVTVRLQRLVGRSFRNLTPVVRRSTARAAILTLTLPAPRERGTYRLLAVAVDRSGNTTLFRGARVRLGAP